MMTVTKVTLRRANPDLKILGLRSPGIFYQQSDDMVSALATLESLPFQPPKKNREQMVTLWIRVAMTEDTGIFHWLKHTHPPIHKRIEALRRGTFLK